MRGSVRAALQPRSTLGEEREALTRGVPISGRFDAHECRAEPLAKPARDAKGYLMRASLLRSALLAAAITLLVTAPVLAAKPDREFAPAPTDIFLPAGIACTFDVNIHVDINQEYTKIWTDPAGNLLMFAVNGNLQVTATNLSTGTSLAINASGPALVRFDAQGNPVLNVAEGHYLGYGGGMTLFTGLLDFNTGAFNGHTTDLCAALS
jgi:hypothetical protein